MSCQDLVAGLRFFRVRLGPQPVVPLLPLCFARWTSTKFSKQQHVLVSTVFQVATSLCVISGVFAAIVFQLLNIYSKAALGTSNDAGYLAFRAATATFRIWGFRAFLVNMSAFDVSFLTQLYNALWEDARQREHPAALTTAGKCIMGGSCLLALASYYVLRAVMNLASIHVFGL